MTGRTARRRERQTYESTYLCALTTDNEEVFRALFQYWSIDLKFSSNFLIEWSASNQSEDATEGRKNKFADVAKLNSTEDNSYIRVFYQISQRHTYGV